MFTGKEEGQFLQPGQNGLQEEITYRYDNSGHWLLLVQKKLETEEIESIRLQRAEFAIYEDGPVIFLLYHFAGKKWEDTPYSWHLVARDKQVYPTEETFADILHVVLVAAESGLVLVNRQVKMSAEFSQDLLQAIIKQAAGTFNGQSYAKHLNGVWNQLTTEEMLAEASTRFQTDFTEKL